MNNNGKVFITYENSTRTNVTGVYANYDLAKKESIERGDLGIIDPFDIKGYRGGNFNIPFIDDCKYFIPRLNTIRELISCLYSLEGCACGGICHIVTDDNNFDDDDLDFVLKECEKEENQDREEIGLAKLICSELKKLSIQQRAIIFNSYYTSALCDNNCDECPINRGEID